jgi:hypothetical protein
VSKALAAVLVFLCAVSIGAAQSGPRPTMQLTPATPTIGARTTIPVYLSFTNPLAVSLSSPRLAIRSGGFDLESVHGLYGEIPPETTIVAELTLRPRSGAFGAHAVVVTLAYDSTVNGRAASASTAGVTSIAIRQPLEDEAKGLPGGTVALLYLLLPVIPAFLAYQLVEQQRSGSPLQVPVFRAEHIPFAFVIAVVVGITRLVGGGRGVEALADPRGLTTIVLFSALAGAALPLVRWIVQIIRIRRWRLTAKDNLRTYVRKALHASSSHEWVSGKIGEQACEGLCVRQPDGTLALGAALQVSPASVETEEAARTWKVLITEAVDEHGRVLDTRRLLRMVKEGTVTLGLLRKIVNGDRQLDQPVLTKGLEGFEQENAEAGVLVKPVR